MGTTVCLPATAAGPELGAQCEQCVQFLFNRKSKCSECLGQKEPRFFIAIDFNFLFKVFFARCCFLVLFYCNKILFEIEEKD